MSRIVQLTAENIKRLRAVDITPDGDIVTIGGRNGQGKTSVLDSIRYALAGRKAVGPCPVRQGEQKATSTVRLDNGMTVTRTFVPGGGALIITNEAGVRYPSPQKMLDELCGALTFDPMAFLSQQPRQQAETLRGLLGLDFAEPNHRRKEIYDKRTLVNRGITELEGQVAGMPQHKDAPQEETNIADLVGELKAAEKQRQENETVRSRLAQMNQELQKVQAEAAHAQDQIMRWQESLEHSNVAIAEQGLLIEQTEKQISALVDPNSSAIEERIRTADGANQKCRENAARRDLAMRIETGRETSRRMTADIEHIEAEKAQALAAANYPVEHMTFDEETVFLHGRPLKETGRAEQIRVSVAIAAACNPDLRIMLIENGSLLDVESRQILAGFAEQQDLQVWLEVVSEDGECSVVISDGQVLEPTGANAGG